MMDPNRPPLPPSKPYRQLLNYLEYVKNSNQDAHVKNFKATIRTNGETKDENFVNLLNITLRNTLSD